MEDVMTTRIETITPEVANEYLHSNVRCNRSVHSKVVSKYARDMKSGNFRITHQGIAFDSDGMLIDGQHRLMACVSSGTPFMSLVTRNIPKDVMVFVDRGASRSIHDSLMVSIAGDDDAARVLKSTQLPAVLRQLAVCSSKEMSLSVTEITDIFNAFQSQVLDLFKLNSAKYNGVNRCQLLSAAIAAMYCGVSTEAIDKFFRCFRKSDITDCAGFNVSAALDWRHQIDEAKYRGIRMSGVKIFLGTQNAIYNFVNNTDVKRVTIPKTPRYDVSDVLNGIFTN